jgi:hypothetical protein
MQADRCVNTCAHVDGVNAWATCMSWDRTSNSIEPRASRGVDAMRSDCGRQRRDGGMPAGVAAAVLLQACAMPDVIVSYFVFSILRGQLKGRSQMYCLLS